MDELLRVLQQLVSRAGANAVASWHSPSALIACMLGDTRFAATTLECLRNPESPAAQQLAAAFPETAGLAFPAPPQIEHDPPIVATVGAGSTRASQPRPLLDHIATRLLGRKLAGLEARDIDLFQDADKPGL